MTGLHPVELVGRARLELATNGLKEVVALSLPIYPLTYIALKTDVRLNVRLIFDEKFESMGWISSF